MDYKNLLFFDIDGTLIDGKTGKVPTSAVEGLKKAQEQGSLLFINTGRCKSFIQECLREIPFDGYCYACGAHIEYQGKVLLEEFVLQKDIDIIRDAMQKSRIQGVFQGPRYCYFDLDAEYYDNFKKFLRGTYDPDYHAQWKSFYEDPMEINKLVTFRDETCDYEYFLKQTKDHYQLIDNGGGFVEILPLPYTKASCIDFLMDYFGIDADHVYVFGDSPNDLPMMTHVGHSICLGNGYDSIKEISEYVTTSVEDDGILNALQHYHIIE